MENSNDNDELKIDDIYSIFSTLSYMDKIAILRYLLDLLKIAQIP